MYSNEPDPFRKPENHPVKRKTEDSDDGDVERKKRRKDEEQDKLNYLKTNYASLTSVPVFRKELLEALARKRVRDEAAAALRAPSSSQPVAQRAQHHAPTVQRSSQRAQVAPPQAPANAQLLQAPGTNAQQLRHEYAHRANSLWQQVPQQPPNDVQAVRRASHQGLINRQRQRVNLQDAPPQARPVNQSAQEALRDHLLRQQAQPALQMDLHQMLQQGLANQHGLGARAPMFRTGLQAYQQPPTDVQAVSRAPHQGQLNRQAHPVLPAWQMMAPQVNPLAQPPNAGPELLGFPAMVAMAIRNSENRHSVTTKGLRDFVFNHWGRYYPEKLPDEFMIRIQNMLDNRSAFFTSRFDSQYLRKRWVHTFKDGVTFEQCFTPTCWNFMKNIDDKGFAFYEGLGVEDQVPLPPPTERES